jgi:hypothetical protein
MNVTKALLIAWMMSLYLVTVSASAEVEEETTEEELGYKLLFFRED